MKRGVKAIVAKPNAYIDTSIAERCTCISLTSWHKEQDLTEEDVEQFIPVPEELNSYLRTVLNSFFPRSTPLSILLLHISQLEHILISPKSAILHKRLRYHAPLDFLEQVLVNIRRTIRVSDQILISSGTAAAIIFPDVDQQGAFTIIERVYNSISLLQSETVIPPLKLETDILLGIGSYPNPGSSLEDMLYHTGLIAHSLTLRPAITTQSQYAKTTDALEESMPARRNDQGDREQARGTTAVHSSVPFMHLPQSLPARLKSLIPYQLACKIRCAPVGRDHHRLTLAMADPLNASAIADLREITGMTIFPVACEVAELDALLQNAW